MGESTNNTKSTTTEYLAQLLKDKKQISAFPNTFVHLERLLDEEISKVRATLLNANNQANFEPLILPEAKGAKITLSDKIYVPTKDHPDFNFIGRILGPRGMTAKHLEQETGCKIMIRGKGSMRDKKKEDQNKGKPNWEHLNDELHVLVSIEDTEERAKIRMQRAREEIERLLVPAAEGEDELKKMQLMELAILNGTFREPNGKSNGGMACNLQTILNSASSPLTLATFSAAGINGGNAHRFLTSSPPGSALAGQSFVHGPGGSFIQLKAAHPSNASPLGAIYLTGAATSPSRLGTAPFQPAQQHHGSCISSGSSSSTNGGSPYPLHQSPHPHHHHHTTLIDGGNGFLYAAATPSAFDLPYIFNTAAATPTFFEYPGAYEGAPATIGAYVR